MTPPPEHPSSIALVRLRVGLGDLLCTWPALRALRARHPDAHVVLVTWEEMRPVVDRMAGLVDELLPFPGWPGIPERPPREDAIPGWLAGVRARRLDVALQAYGANPAANEVTEALGATWTGGFVVPGHLPARFDPARHVPYPHGIHEVDRLLALAGLLGAEPDGDGLGFPLTAADRDEADRLGLASPFALVHPGATSPSRRWPAERFAAVADALAARGLRVAVTGVPGEEARVRAVLGAMRAPAVDLCGATSLGGFAALLARARVLVASDTGTVHLAAAVGTPSVAVFLSGDPVRWAHPAPRHAVARVRVECNPCPYLTCPIDHRCATRLTVEHVLARVDGVLAATAGGGGGHAPATGPPGDLAGTSYR